MRDNIKILVVSNAPCRGDNSFGNTFLNIFTGMGGIETANIYCGYGSPDNNVITRYFQITEKSLIKNLINKNFPAGREIKTLSDSDILHGRESRVTGFLRKHKSQVLFWARSLIWKVGRWKSKELIAFVDEFKPDILFIPIYDSMYLNDIGIFLKHHTGAKAVTYITDDNYSLRQFSLSPLFWINRFLVRRKIREIVAFCDIVYVISAVQKREYGEIFGKECRILTKGADFAGGPPLKKEYNNPLKFIYTGNMGAGRTEMLGLMADSLKSVNADGIKAQLFIYTMTPLTDKIKKRLQVNNSSFLMGGITPKQVKEVQKDADVLVHVESFGLKERLLVHQSLSTKIVDYFSSGRCIFAVGSLDVASIDHLSCNDAAVIATSKKAIFTKLSELVNNADLLTSYAGKAWECGKRNHRIEIIQENLYRELSNLACQGKNEGIAY